MQGSPVDPPVARARSLPSHGHSPADAAVELRQHALDALSRDAMKSSAEAARSTSRWASASPAAPSRAGRPGSEPASGIQPRDLMSHAGSSRGRPRPRSRPAGAGRSSPSATSRRGRDLGPRHVDADAGVALDDPGALQPRATRRPGRRPRAPGSRPGAAVARAGRPSARSADGRRVSGIPRSSAAGGMACRGGQPGPASIRMRNQEIRGQRRAGMGSRAGGIVAAPLPGHWHRGRGRLASSRRCRRPARGLRSQPWRAPGRAISGPDRADEVGGRVLESVDHAVLHEGCE